MLLSTCSVESLIFHDWLVTGKEENLDTQGYLKKSLLEASASNVAFADFVCRRLQLGGETLLNYQ